MNNILAAIDVGTNSFHLIVVEVSQAANFKVIDQAREVIRLNEGNVNDIKRINEPAEMRAIETLKNFKGIADSHKAALRAVATSAVRESQNRDNFIQKVFDATGVEIEVISGIEEARLIYLGILKAVPVFDRQTLCIDIGGGSTEFLIGLRGDTKYSNSMKLGAVRLTQKFFPDLTLSKEKISECKEWIEGEIYSTVHEISKQGFSTVVGSSGTIQSAGFMVLAKRKKNAPDFKILNNFEFSLIELMEIESEILARKTVEKRKKMPGLEEKRADIIPAGIILLSTIMNVLKIEKIIISEYALREGIIIDTIEKQFLSESTPKIHNIRLNSVRHLAEISDFDREHCRHVANLALQLFDQTVSIHRLNEQCREYLEAAALLHDIGYHISHELHHKHSYYIIRNSNLLGFNDSEIAMIANVARYHRKSHPKQRHIEFSSLSERNQEVVIKLSAILRVVDSLDRTHKKLISNLGVEIKNNILELNLIVDGEYPGIELWNLERRKELFEITFNKKLQVNLNDNG